MRRWAIIAKEELQQMNRLAAALPLADALKSSVSIINLHRLNVAAGKSPSGKDWIFLKRRSKGLDACLTEAALVGILSLFLGKDQIDIAVPYETIDLISLIRRTKPLLPETPYDSTLSCLLALNESVLEWMKRLEASGVVSSLCPSSVELMAVSSRLITVISARKTPIPAADARLALDIAIVSELLSGIAGRFKQEELDILHSLFAAGPEAVRRYRKAAKGLVGIDSGAGKRSASERIWLLRRKYALACPRALGELDMQSYTVIRKPARYQVRLDPVQPAPERPNLSANEARERIRLEFPHLYNIMMRPPRLSKTEQKKRAEKRRIRHLIREGVSPQFIGSCLLKGIRDPAEIADLFTSKLQECRDLGAEAAGVVPNKVHRAKAGTAQAAPFVKPAVTGPRTRAELLESIRFPEYVNASIAEYGSGLTSREVVFGMCKGFDFGKPGGGAVGSGHYRGAVIRRNIRRHCTVNPEVLLDYLRSVDLLREFGSSASTRTKDEAMSIKTNPENAIERGILRTLNAAFHAHRANGQGR